LTDSNIKQESFADLLDEVFSEGNKLVGSVLKGTVVSHDRDYVIVDVGLKSEGKIPVREFLSAGEGDDEIKDGDTVDVYLERLEGSEGEIMLSREKARREEAWGVLEKSFETNEKVNGIIFGRVKGGFTVDLSGATAFLPTSQMDIRPIKDPSALMNEPQPFIILKMDRKRGNIVVSRRAVLEETRAEARSELIANLTEGQVLQGVVKNITDYGAFVDLGGVDGLLHVTDISWKRINHPSEVLQLGQNIDVQVIRFNAETQRISLGVKQLEEDPWLKAIQKYPVDMKLSGRVTNITDYGAFIELEEGIEGLAHVSEMSWIKKNVHPGKIVSTSQEVEVIILDVEPEKRRISLGLKQCVDNPWQAFSDNYPAGTEISGEVKNVTEFGLFVGLPGDIDGMVHMSDLSWEKAGDQAVKEYNKGDQITVKVMEVDVSKERITLGVKQLSDDPFALGIKDLKRGSIVTCTITNVMDAGIEVDLGEGAKGFIRKQDLSRDRSEQRSSRFAVGEKVDAKLMSIDKDSRKVSLSIKARELEEEKEAMAQFGSTDSGASLGNILGEALNKAKSEKED
jgi:small subunit ribosomal protein S1